MCDEESNLEISLSLSGVVNMLSKYFVLSEASNSYLLPTTKIYT